MTTLVRFDDSVTAANLSRTQTVGVYYTDGEFANEAAVREQLPHAEHFMGITVEGRTGKGNNICDCEKFDRSVPQTVQWIEEQIKLTVELVGAYASSSTWHDGGLWDKLEKYGDRIKRWFADYVSPANETCTVTYDGVTYECDAHQYAGGDVPVDSNVCLPTFLVPTYKTKKPTGAIPTTPPRKNTGRAFFTGYVDMANVEMHIHHMPSGDAHYLEPETLKYNIGVEVKPGHHAVFTSEKQ